MLFQNDVFVPLKALSSRNGLRVPPLLVSAMAQFSLATATNVITNIAAIKPDDPLIETHRLSKYVWRGDFLVENLGENQWWKGKWMAF